MPNSYIYITTSGVYQTGLQALQQGDTLTIVGGVSILRNADTSQNTSQLLGSSQGVNTTSASNGTINNAGWAGSYMGVVFMIGSSNTVNNTGDMVNYSNVQYRNFVLAFRNFHTLYNQVSNSGRLTAALGDVIQADGSGPLSVTNTGRIEALNAAGDAFRSTGTGSLSIQNSGSVSGASAVAGSLSLTNDAGAQWSGDISLTGTQPAYISNYGDYHGGISRSGSGYLSIYNTGHFDSYIALASGYTASLVIDNRGYMTGLSTGNGTGDNEIDNYGSIGRLDLSFGSNTVNNYGVVRDAILAGDVSDTIVNSGTIFGSVYLYGGDDKYDGSKGTGTIVVGGMGNDTLIGGAGADVFYGDNISGDTTGGADILYGGYGDDVLNGGYGADALYGNQGDDVLYGNQDNDWVHGGQGDDVVYGGQGDDIVYGGVGNDIVYGNLGNDQMYGGDGNDVMYGGQDQDTMDGGAGDDVLYGNLGDDVFVFSGPGFGHDTIADFINGNGADRIRFGPGTFANLADVQAHAVNISGGVLITDSFGDSVYLLGVTAGQLTAGQFIFG